MAEAGGSYSNMGGRYPYFYGPEGRLVLVEGVWGTVSPVGIPADRLTALLAPLTAHARVERLSDDPRLWGGPVTDERYAVVATVRPALTD